MHRQMRACTDEFLSTVTEGVVHGVYKVVAQPSFGITLKHKASGGKWAFRHSVRRLHTNLRWQLKDRGVSPNATTT